jgi:hypothetical protein
VPAGNVIATLAGPTLTLTGDDLGNSVQLLPGSQPNEVVVQGNGTTVNGSTAPQVFAGVEDLAADLRDGNDRLTVQGVTISAPSFSQVYVDGGAGDDRIELIDSSIHAVDFIDLQIYGERVSQGVASGTTGNDTILVSGTSLTSNAFVSVQLDGETNDGGVVTGGNDTITVADSVIAASGGFFHAVQVQIVGDANSSVGGQTSTIGGGNDKISVSNTTISATSDVFSFGNTASLTILGDSNSANGFNPATSSGADAASTIGGGNDSIDVKNVTVAVGGPNFGTSQTSVMIAGSHNNVAGFPGATTTGTIGGGNDKITVADSTVAATGNQFTFNGAVAEIRGDDIQVIGPAGTTSVVGGGADAITVRNTNVTAAGPSGDFASLVVRSEYVVTFGGAVSTVGNGNDVVKVNNVHVSGTAVEDFGLLMVETGSGNDRLDITDSSARFFTVHLGDGDDELKFDNNVVGEEASLDGGLGFDRIRAHGNTGLLIWFDFEDENVTP